MKWYDLTFDYAPFMQMAFNLSNGVNDTLESSSILIYLETRMGLYTQKRWLDAILIKWFIKQ